MIERREFQRLRLREPIAARFDGSDVMLVELGVLGGRAELAQRMPTGSAATLAIADLSLSFDAIVVYEGESSAMSALPYQIGIRFLAAVDSSNVKLRRVLAELVQQEIELARRFAAPAATLSFDPDETAMRLPAPFIAYRFENGTWHRRGVFVPTQPDSGFTLPDSVPFDEARQLSASYEESDEEGRRLIRLFAELHICEKIGVPPVTQSVRS